MNTSTALSVDHWVDEHLRKNPYPGRVIVIGQNGAGEPTVVYGIMGRSSDSRDRGFIHDPASPNDVVRTATASGRELPPEKAALVIYPAIAVKRLAGGRQAIFVTNGEQTQGLLDNVGNEDEFESVLSRYNYEPDKPNYTARISGMIAVNEKGGWPKLTLSIITPDQNDETDPPRAIRRTFSDLEVKNGQGHMLTTYATDGNPLPAFQYGEPLPVPLFGGTEDIANFYWAALNEDNRVALVVRTFGNDGSPRDMHIIHGRGTPIQG